MGIFWDYIPSLRTKLLTTSKLRGCRVQGLGFVLGQGWEAVLGGEGLGGLDSFGVARLCMAQG